MYSFKMDPLRDKWSGLLLRIKYFNKVLGALKVDTFDGK